MRNHIIPKSLKCSNSATKPTTPFAGGQANACLLSDLSK